MFPSQLETMGTYLILDHGMDKRLGLGVERLL